ncbi:hypothetical protein AB4K20DRAFT_1917083 [Rhizopus microsporus]
MKIVYALFILCAVSAQAIPVFDAELVASPFIHERTIRYRGGSKTPNITSEKNVNLIKEQ